MVAKCKNLDKKKPKIFLPLSYQASYLLRLVPEYVQVAAINYRELDIRTYLGYSPRLINFCKFHSLLRFRSLIDLVVYDRPSKRKRFSVLYLLLSLRYNVRLIIRTQTNTALPLLSIIRIFQNAGWLEREAWDMFGIFFYHHADLRRLLSDYGFKGHPLRKDFPLTGYIELWYSEYVSRMLYVPVSLVQEYRRFLYPSPWGAERSKRKSRKGNYM